MPIHPKGSWWVPGSGCPVGAPDSAGAARPGEIFPGGGGLPDRHASQLVERL
ncbi:hypothetical protein HUT18_22255 [Streptomyces sp. NA04227]|nr:hypothetical protein HUT18_22255 [Streptomyces sp. NA04227]